MVWLSTWNMARRRLSTRAPNGRRLRPRPIAGCQPHQDEPVLDDGDPILAWLPLQLRVLRHQIYRRRPRTKTVAHELAELDQLRAMPRQEPRTTPQNCRRLPRDTSGAMRIA